MTSFSLSTSAPNILVQRDSDAILEAKSRLVEIIDSARRHKSVASTIEEESPESVEYDEPPSRPAAESDQFLAPPAVHYAEHTCVQYATSNLENSSEKNSRYHHIRSELIRKPRRRAILKNGDCNIVQVHIAERGRRFLQDIFTTLVDAQWRWTFLTFVMSFLLSWLAFAMMWWLIAYSHGDFLEENRANSSWIPCVVNIDGFVSSFLYSIETQHSTGYGSRAPTPECIEALFLLCVQSIIGVMIQAFMVGIVFAKMSRPKKRKQTLLFSKTCVICQRDGYLCLLFRVGDMREKSHLINATIRLYLIQSKHTQEGEVLTPYLQELTVQVDDYNDNVLLIWPLTVVHKIDANSPLFEMSAGELLYERFEIVAVLEGTTESTGQTTQARTSYVTSEILWGHRFEPIVKYNKEKLCYEVDYDLFHDTYQVDTPLCSADQLQQYLHNQLEAT